MLLKQLNRIYIYSLANVSYINITQLENEGKGIYLIECNLKKIFLISDVRTRSSLVRVRCNLSLSYISHTSARGDSDIQHHPISVSVSASAICTFLHPPDIN